MMNDRGGDQKRQWTRHNEQIRIPQILVIQDGQNLGVMQTRDALALARSVGLDLVEVAANCRPPVCHIMDYGKFKYDESKKNKVKQHTQKEKEVSFRYVIDDNDLETKAGQCRKFIEKGMKVKLVVKFKAREKAHRDQGFVVINKMIDLLKEVTTVENQPGFEGANVTAKLAVKKAKKD